MPRPATVQHRRFHEDQLLAVADISSVSPVFTTLKFHSDDGDGR